jgi:two-component system cell cycle response regulator DivK
MKKILVIEDNLANMKLTVLLLEKHGYHVLQAHDAEGGLAMARSQVPDLILMDVHLPGMDGLAATRVLKADQATAAIRIIALTGLAMKGDEQRIRAAGCDGYIAKPIRYESFMRQISAALCPSQE